MFGSKTALNMKMNLKLRVQFLQYKIDFEFITPHPSRYTKRREECVCDETRGVSFDYVVFCALEIYNLLHEQCSRLAH